MKVIIADDDTGTRLLLEHTLVKWDYEVVSTKNGLEALETLLNEKESCLAILDWVMPEMDGVEVCRILRNRQSAQGYIYIMILTGKKRKEDVVQGLEAGADDFLIKPFDFQELRMRLRVGQRILSLQEQLKVMAYHDSLTEMLNRLAIMEILQKELSRAQREKKPVSVIMCDLDYFKNVNDTHGHLCGDAVLKEAAKRLKSSVRVYDSIGRYGGEEFLIVLPDVNQLEASRLAERLRSSLSDTPISYEGKSIAITMSMGVADNLSDQYSDVDSIIRFADEALYLAKNKGRNRVVLSHSTSIDESVTSAK